MPLTCLQMGSAVKAGDLKEGDLVFLVMFGESIMWEFI